MIPISVFNLQWELTIAPKIGWVPVWRDPVIASSVFLSCMISLLVYNFLLQKKKHSQLLKSMLPKKIIRHLQTSDNLFAEGFETVTIMFADIVNYTVIASQLTPFQVVKFL